MSAHPGHGGQGGHPGPAVIVTGLRVEMAHGGGDIVDEVSFSIAPGEVLGLAGESGSGKTTVGLALLGHARRGARVTGGSVRVGAIDVLSLTDRELREVRGRIISYVPQDPAAALNPALRVGTQLREVLRAHRACASAREASERIVEMLREVALPAEPAFIRRYPHELSGGQQQRIALAMAFACRPRLVVLDEPTTGLDVTTQAHVLATVRKLAASHQVAALYISHDLAVIAGLAQRLAVMYAGRIVEVGAAAELLAAAAHPYTRRLVAAIPRLTGQEPLTGIPGRAPAPGDRPPGCAFAPRCELAAAECRTAMPALAVVGAAHLARCPRAAAGGAVTTGPAASRMAGLAAPAGTAPVLSAERIRAGYRDVTIVKGVSLAIARGECLALVGESGSGKTTFARAIAGLHPPASGRVLLDGQPLAATARRRPAEARRRMQYVFQNPYGSLNPRRTVRQIVGQPLRVLGGGTRQAADRRVAEVLEQVSLPPAIARCYPDQLSGGERQRVAIARALVSAPAVLICDEVTSALDVSVQAAIVELLTRLRADLGLAILFITHNLPLVGSIADRVAVMAHGQVIEVGATRTVLRHPSAPYTRQLIASAPALGPAGRAIPAWPGRGQPPAPAP